MALIKNITGKNFRVVLLIFAVLVLALVPQAISQYHVSLLIMSFIFAIFAMSLDLITGYMGHSSLGHAAFFGGAAYALAIADTRLGLEFISASLFALLFTLLLAMVFGLLVAKISDVQFLLVNLALGQVVWGLAYRWNSMTGGDNGIRGITQPVLAGVEFSGITFYYLALVIFVVSTVLLYLLVNSPFGQTVKGIKQSQSRMRVLGYNVWLHKYIAYILSAVFAGVAGILWAYFNRYVSPSDVSLVMSSKSLLIVLLGGAGTLFGSIISATLVTFLENFVSGFTDRWVIFMGALYVIVVIFLPNGLYGLLQTLAVRFKLKTTMEEVDNAVKE